MKIIQIVSNYMRGDAVSKVADTIEKSIRSIGVETEMLSGLLTEELVESGIFNDDTIILYHLSVRMDPFLQYVNCKKVLVFHNITTPELLIGFNIESLRIDCEAGLYELSKTVECFDYAIAFSDYSRNTLIEQGWNDDKIITLPIIVKFDELSGESSNHIIDRFSDGKKNFTFFGRLFPNKKQEDIIRCFERYKRKYNANSRLILVGSGKAPKYEMLLKKLVEDLDICDDVVFTGFVTQEEYISYYKISDCFICMSEHEGFCIPLVEAMYFDVPIIAYSSTAIPSTLEGAGILLDSKDPDVVSDYMNKVITEKEYRDKIIEGQRKRLEHLKLDTLGSEYTKAIKKITEKPYVKDDKLDSEKHIYFGQSIFSMTVPKCIEKSGDPIVIYGMGKWGKQLCYNFSVSPLSNRKVLCDSNCSDGDYNGYDIKSFEEAIHFNADAYWIVTPEKKETAIQMIVILINKRVPLSRIATYDGYLNIISMIEG